MYREDLFYLLGLLFQFAPLKFSLIKYNLIIYLIEFTKHSFSNSFLFHKADLLQKDLAADSYNFALKLLTSVYSSVQRLPHLRTA